jgi:hypothetical protein
MFYAFAERPISEPSSEVTSLKLFERPHFELPSTLNNSAIYLVTNSKLASTPFTSETLYGLVSTGETISLPQISKVILTLFGSELNIAAQTGFSSSLKNASTYPLNSRPSLVLSLISPPSIVKTLALIISLNEGSTTLKLGLVQAVFKATHLSNLKRLLA